MPFCFSHYKSLFTTTLAEAVQNGQKKTKKMCHGGLEREVGTGCGSSGGDVENANFSGITTGEI